MKRYLALVLLVLGCICCASPPAPPPDTPVAVAAEAKPRTPDVTAVRMWRSFELTLHADTAFSPDQRDAISEGAAQIGRLTQDRARLGVVFDVDFDSIENLKGHNSAAHSVILGICSWYEIGRDLEAKLSEPGAELNGVTQPLADGSRAVFLFLDRLRDPAKFRGVVTHELGHVIGLPDLKERGAIMSGFSVRGVPEPADWTDADRALCREHHYCE